MRGLINTLRSKRLDALSDFQNLYKTDTAIFPTHLVAWLVDSLDQDEKQQAQKRPELKRLILKVHRNLQTTKAWVDVLHQVVISQISFFY